MTNFGEDEFDDQEAGPSKSELKRRMAELQKLSEALSNLGDDDLRNLALPESLLDSLKTASRIKSSSARNRQLRHATKLLDKCGEETVQRISSYFEAKQASAKSISRRHKVVEEWRDRLLANPQTALSDLFEQFPEADRQEIRTLVRIAVKEREKGSAPAQQRKLFAYLRDRLIN